MVENHGVRRQCRRSTKLAQNRASAWLSASRGSAHRCAKTVTVAPRLLKTFESVRNDADSSRRRFVTAATSFS